MRLVAVAVLLLLARLVASLHFSLTLQRLVLNGPAGGSAEGSTANATVEKDVQGVDGFSLEGEDTEEDGGGLMTGPWAFQIAILELLGVSLSTDAPKEVGSKVVPVTIRREGPSPEELNGLQNDAFYPEEEETTAKGLTRLVCQKLNAGSFQLQSFVAHEPAQSPGFPPIYLVPLNEPNSHPLYQALHLLFGGDNAPVLRFAVLITYEDHQGEVPLVPPLDWSSCVLQILPLQEQTYLPRGSFISGQEEAIVGQASLQEGEPSRAKVARETTEELVSNLNSVACGPDSSLGNSTVPSFLRVASATEEAMQTKLTVTEFVQDFGFAAMVGPIIEGICKPMIEPFAGTVTNALGGSLIGTMGGHMESGFNDLIPMELGRSISPAISQQLVPTLMETLTDTVPEVTSHMTAVYVTKELSDRMTKNLVQRLQTTLSKELPEIVDISVPNEIDQDLLRSLGRVLPKAMVHSLVPALAHTLTHSPLQDYYCYYCFHESEYCAFCNYSPQQLYYAMYYAGWYSSWYADYFCEYYAKVMEDERSDQGSERNTRLDLQKFGQTVQGSSVALVLNPDTWKDSARSVTRDDSTG